MHLASPNLLAALRRAVLGLAVFAAAAGATAAPGDSKEYALKAAFLYNFTKFVAWPVERFGEAATPFVIGVFGESPFDADLEAEICARKVDGRPVKLLTVTTAADAQHVHILFVPAGQERAAQPVLAALRESAVLAVGETDAFRQQGGAITFVVEGDKLRFIVDMDAADRARLKVSAQLLKLAKRVQRNS